LKITYHGHSVLHVETESSSIWIDPFLTYNGLCHAKPDEVKADVILLTHGHNDHVGDTVEIAKRTGALVVAPFELAEYLEKKDLNTHAMHIGGAREFDWGKVKFTQAFHGSSFTEEDGNVVYTGMPAGILLTINGKTLYHAGDTALFSDMKLIGERNSIDAAFLPIGDNFTMGPEDASDAASWINAKLTVPIHFNTFPVIKQDAHAFVDKLKVPGKVLESGETITI
jgi:L-ascorbate metabolism protein UlaG (beta-lactamase superfamily)